MPIFEGIAVASAVAGGCDPEAGVVLKSDPGFVGPLWGSPVGGRSLIGGADGLRRDPIAFDRVSA